MGICCMTQGTQNRGSVTIYKAIILQLKNKVAKKKKSLLLAWLALRSLSRWLKEVEGLTERKVGQGSGGAVPPTLGRRLPGKLLSCPTGRLDSVPSSVVMDAWWNARADMLCPVTGGGKLCVLIDSSSSSGWGHHTHTWCLCGSGIVWGPWMIDSSHDPSDRKSLEDFLNGWTHVNLLWPCGSLVLMVWV